MEIPIELIVVAVVFIIIIIIAMWNKRGTKFEREFRNNCQQYKRLQKDVDRMRNELFND